MSKHTTLGPWKLVEDRLMEQYFVVVPCGNSTHRIGSVARVDVSCRLPEAEYHANARLIAAAPELFEVAKIAETALNHIIGHCPPHTWPKEIDGLKKALGDIRKLLKRIEGD